MQYHSPSHYPITPLPHSSIYRTGDLARWLSDGNIEFFGRMDHQVKIRGFRIEIGEIETRLSAHPEIKKALVIDRDNGKGDKYLCAYIVAGSVGVTPDAATLRNYLSEILPGFMIPSYFVLVEKFPLTPNGKVDRKALPAPGISTGQEYLAPGNEIEEQLVEIWSEVLNLEKEIIGVKDNFFDLGGNSLKVMQLNSKLKKTYERDIPAVKMFKYPTIRLFAGYINANVNQESIRGETNRSRSDRSEARSKGKSRLKNLKRSPRSGQPKLK
jgi:surfactin family lipopeptide synthetase A/bacitracin synthase 1/bacitracin synthase 2/bacitracin synthase 3